MRYYHAISLMLACVLCGTTIPVHADGPGGILEQQNLLPRSRWTQAQVLAATPDTRGTFLFPAPYNTRAIRITDPSDCGGVQDCVKHVGYSYFPAMNSHELDPQFLYLFVYLDTGRGGTGANLYRVDKTTDTITKVGPMFPVGHFLRNVGTTGEMWSFFNSPANPYLMYIPVGPRLYKYHILTQALTVIFDITATFVTNRDVWQPKANADDSKIVFSVRNPGTGTSDRCVVFTVATSTFLSYTGVAPYDECHIDKSGRYLHLQENSVAGPVPNGTESHFIDIVTNTHTTILDNNGGLGHSDAGWGYFVGIDNWNNVPGAVISFEQPNWAVQGGQSVRTPHYRSYLPASGGTWSGFNPMNHVTHNNAAQGVAKSNQYFCGSNADTIYGWQNELGCARLDFSAQQLIVAPVMTDPNASGGGVASNGCFDNFYCKHPFATIDRTGEYLMWTTNMGTNRLDAYLVHIPKQLLTADITAPAPPTGVRIQ
jgi:hypothetical protein